MGVSGWAGGSDFWGWCWSPGESAPGVVGRPMVRLPNEKMLGRVGPLGRDSSISDGMVHPA